MQYLFDLGILFFLNEERGAFITVKPYIEKSALFHTALNLNYDDFNALMEIYFKLSLNNISPYEEAYNFIGKDNMEKFHIKKIDYDDIDLTIRLLKK